MNFHGLQGQLLIFIIGNYTNEVENITNPRNTLKLRSKKTWQKSFLYYSFNLLIFLT